jgi:hypothetical protein
MAWIFLKPPVVPPDWSQPLTLRISGIRMSGKSSYLETAACNILEASRVKNRDGSLGKITSNCWDIYSSADAESISWLDSIYKDSVVLLKDPSAVVSCPDWIHVKDYSACHPEDESSRGDLDPSGGHIYILVNSFFPTEATKFQALGELMTRFKMRNDYSTIDILLIREASAWLNSIMVSTKGSGAMNLMLSRMQMTALHSELSHHAVSLLIDVARDVTLERTIRMMSSWALYCRIGGLDWARSMNWVGGYISWETLRSLPKGWALAISDTQSVALCKYEMEPWHFQKRGESLLKRFGISVIFDAEALRAANQTFRGRSVDEQTHRKIVVLRQGGMSFEQIGKETGLPTSTTRYHFLEVHGGHKCRCPPDPIQEEHPQQ